MLAELVLKNRSYRRFYEEVKLSSETLRELVDLARLSASAANLQPLRFYLSNSSETNAVIFNTLGWAGYLEDWSGPETGERPSAYIIVLLDTAISGNSMADEGIAAQSILLGAVEKGYGGCILGNVKRGELKAGLGIDEHLNVLLAIALGKPKEEVVIEPLGSDGNIRYWRSNDKIHHVPKRSLDDILI
jgi:nitroreductase